MLLVVYVYVIVQTPVFIHLRFDLKSITHVTKKMNLISNTIRWIWCKKVLGHWHNASVQVKIVITFSTHFIKVKHFYFIILWLWLLELKYLFGLLLSIYTHIFVLYDHPFVLYDHPFVLIYFLLKWKINLDS